MRAKIKALKERAEKIEASATSTHELLKLCALILCEIEDQLEKIREAL